MHFLEENVINQILNEFLILRFENSLAEELESRVLHALSKEHAACGRQMLRVKI